MLLNLRTGRNNYQPVYETMMILRIRKKENLA